MKTLYSTRKEILRAVRSELKQKFPGAKFYVRCGTGWARDGLFITWSDGPSLPDVRKATLKWQHWFDTNHTHVVNEDGEIVRLGGFNSVHCHRSNH